MITNLISHNPYRILGVFSNSPKKDVLSNINKMKAFLKVGKEVSFPLDLPTLIPSIHRDEAMVTTAQSAIELPMDQIKHSLFWFIKITPFDEVAFNHLFSGNINQAKEIWSKKESVSSLLNLMACALIENDWIALAINADTLFQKYSNEFCSTVNETVKMSSSRLTELYVEQLKEEGGIDLTQLAQVSGTSSEWRKVFGGSMVKPIIDEITYAINEAKGVKGSSANYNAGVKLMNSTKNSLTRLRALLGISDMQYQVVADKLATTILQCGINYFNDTNDDDAPDKAMKLQSYAISIAVGQMAKDRCKENVDILKKIGPNYKINKEQASILNSASNSSFYALGDGHLAKLILRLQSFKNIAGMTHSVYLETSSLLVMIVTNKVVEKINQTINDLSYNSLLESQVGIYSDNKKETIKIGFEILKALKHIDKDSKAKKYFSDNFSLLKKLNKKYNTPTGLGCLIWLLITIVGSLIGGVIFYFFNGGDFGLGCGVGVSFSWLIATFVVKFIDPDWE